MSIIEAKKAINNLPEGEKMNYFEELWESLYHEYNEIVPNNNDIKIVKKRLKSYKNGTSGAMDWTEFKKKIINEIQS